MSGGHPTWTGPPDRTAYGPVSQVRNDLITLTFTLTATKD